MNRDNSFLLGVAVVFLSSIVLTTLWAHNPEVLRLVPATIWLVTLGVYIIVFGLFGYAASGKLYGVLIDKDGMVSLSRFQLVAWTVLLLSALQAAGILNSALVDFPYPEDKPPEVLGALDIAIPAQIWALLGLGAFTALAEPNLSEGRANRLRATDGRKTGWSNMVSDERGKPTDIAQIQLLALTTLLLAVYAMEMFGIFPPKMASEPKPIATFPEISGGFLALLGVSHATFLARRSSLGKSMQSRTSVAAGPHE
ncbi:MAG: hypothetical protein ABJM58_12205 [Alteripontixanthobacter sp.]